jgi:pimeloyl-ACP methyl ester carboxylesterase/AraC-like DNA-binding protein
MPEVVADAAVRRAMDLIHRQYADELTIEQLARCAGVSRTVLAERFDSAIGQSPMRYCMDWRLRMAAEMLERERHTASEVGYAVGFGSEAAFNRAFRRRYGEPPARWRRQRAEDASRELPAQQVLHCLARDGTQLAWSRVGRGFPLVKTANWLNHLEFDWQSPVWRPWLIELTGHNQLIRYDERGNGLSDWDVRDLSFEAMVDDLEAVVEASGVQHFDLLGLSQGASVAIAYSLRHPGRVRRMVLLGGYAQGWAVRCRGEELARREAMVTLTRTGWGSDISAFRQMFANLYIPGGSPDQLGWWTELQRVSTSPANAERLQRALSTIDVEALLSQVTVPTLVAHCDRDHVVPSACGAHLAERIPGARLLRLDCENHVPLQGEPAWLDFLAALREFLRPPALSD